MNRQDIKQVNNQIVILDNDLVWVDSDEQHIADTINAFPGYWKQFPAEGVGVFSYLRSRGTEQQLGKAVRLNLTADGYNVGNCSVNFDSDGQLNINPNASR